MKSQIFLAHVPSANYYFTHICVIRLCLRDLTISSNDFLKKMGKTMMSKFEKYWGTSSPVLVIASIMDPRTKMKSIELNMKQEYPNIVINILIKLKRFVIFY